MKTGNITSVNCQEVCSERKSSRKIHSKEFIVRHLGMLTSSLELDYTPDTDFDAQFLLLHVAEIYSIRFQQFCQKRDN